MGTSLRFQRAVASLLIHLLLVLGAVFCVFPFIWTLSSSIKPVEELFLYPPRLLPNQFRPENYTRLISEFPYLTWYKNSLLIGVVVTLVSTFFSALGGFGFAKYDFRFRQQLFAVLMVALIVPRIVTFVPAYIEMALFGWIDSYWALIVPAATPAFGIFLMRQYFAQAVPNEILDAARIDGSSEFNTFVKVALPLVRPAVGAFAIYEFLGTWNSFFWPLVIIRSDRLLTLPLGLALFNARVEMKGEWGVMMAGIVLSLVPIFALFLLLQRQFISGLTLGAVKG